MQSSGSHVESIFNGRLHTLPDRLVATGSAAAATADSLDDDAAASSRSSSSGTAPKADNAIIIAVASWSVEFLPACEEWATGLAQRDGEALLAAIRILRDQGPALGRPLVDSIKASRHNNMKELRPGSTGRSEVRVLFAFDLDRQAILLVGGDKSDNWKGWYEKNIPIADDRFDQHQASLAQKRRSTTRTATRKRKESKR